jgi:hypothetical protein
MELAAIFLTTRIVILKLIKFVHHTKKKQKKEKQSNNQTKLGLTYVTIEIGNTNENYKHA